MEPSVSSLHVVKESDDPIKLVEEGLVVKSETPSVFKVSFTTDSPDEVKTLLGTLLRKYLDDANRIDNQTKTDRNEKLDKLYKKMYADVQGKDRDLRRLIETNETLGKNTQDRV